MAAIPILKTSQADDSHHRRHQMERNTSRPTQQQQQKRQYRSIPNPFVLCVATNKCPPVGSTQNSDAAQIICPYTGSTLSTSSSGAGPCTLKTGTGVGIHSMVRFPSHFTQTTHSNAFLAYGGTNRDDMNAILLHQGASNNSSSPLWKCRLPEYMSGGIILSPCGRYIIGGGSSGNCYCWSAMGEDGALLKIWTAHYRPVSCLTTSDCGSFVITGGKDGVVNAWSLMEIVSCDDDFDIVGHTNSSSLNPIKTWSEHQLDVTALHTLPSSRIVSSSTDRQVVIMEIFTAKTLARILMPSSISAISSDVAGHRLYLGGTNGVIYCLDLDSYAIATTAEGATVIDGGMSSDNRRKNKRKNGFINDSNSNNKNDNYPNLSGSRLEETILGHGFVSGNESSSLSASKSYISELRGHERAVSSLSILEGGSLNSNDLLVSGGEDGTIRVWDIRSRCCARVLRPWSSTAAASTAAAAAGGQQQVSLKSSGTSSACFPCSSIIVLPRESIEGQAIQKDSMFLNTRSSSRNYSKENGRSVMINLIKPLQRFPIQLQKEGRLMSRNDDSNDAEDFESAVSILQPVRDYNTIKNWENFGEEYNFNSSLFPRKRARSNDVSHSSAIMKSTEVGSGNRSSDNQGNDTDSIKQSNYDDGEFISMESLPASSNSPKETERLIDEESKAEIQRLKNELETAKSTIERWKNVNNKLAQKLKKASK